MHTVDTMKLQVLTTTRENSHEHALLALQFLKERGYTDRQIAESVACSRETINKVYNGKKSAGTRLTHKLKYVVVKMIEQEKAVKLQPMTKPTPTVVDAVALPSVQIPTSAIIPTRVHICHFCGNIVKPQDLLLPYINWYGKAKEIDAHKLCYEQYKIDNLPTVNTQQVPYAMKQPNIKTIFVYVGVFIIIAGCRFLFGKSYISE